MEHPSLIGKKFERLTVVGQLPSRRFECPSGPATVRYWDCRCICGNHREVSTSNLTSGEVRSCGCLFHPTGFHKRPYESTYNSLVAAAKTRKISLELSYEEFLSFTRTHACFYCGNPVHWNKGEKGGVRTNLDRKDNALGYIKDNCVVCCKICNRVKGDVFTFEEFFFLMLALKKFRKGRQRGWKSICIEVLRGN